ncbi:MAG TPA: thioredoxin domain-containing protein [Candidatus Peribacteraceae bacterium]|nr:thioredoxin domain-containing protein [Candidatus Peribacteraceae bacterium]
MNTQNGNPWFASTLGLLGLIVGYALASAVHGGYIAPPQGGSPTLAANTSSTAQAPTPPAPTGTAPTPGMGPTEGNPNAKVTVIEYTDFQCPFCERHFSQTYPQIKKDYIDTGKIKYELRYFPLTSIHPNAEKSAEAADCAQDQGKFWEMHDKLFSTQNDWANLDNSGAVADFKQYAAGLGLDTTKFNSCLDNGEKASDIQKYVADGGKAGIDGTPGFWVIGPNGKTQQISGAYPYATFQSAIDGMLQ